MMKTSIICVYNDVFKLNSQLLASIDTVNHKYEMILIDNNKMHFTSAASALNYGASKASGEILIFVHQDIYFKSCYELEKLVDVICENEIGTIVGTQGVRDKSKIYYSNITAGECLVTSYVTEFSEKQIEVSCVDEGCFGMKQSTWKMYKFDEKLCDNWHLYAVEMCLRARSEGHKVLVAPIQLHHFSYGHISDSYMNNMKLICRRYHKDFKYVWTTCYKVRTHPLYINILVFAWKLNRRIRGKI